MKVGLLGDIHGNAPALDAVLAAATGVGVNRLLVTGDLVGYYFEPRRVLNRLSSFRWESVRGNHEDMLDAARRDPRTMELVRSRYGSGIEVALAELGEVWLDRLCALPRIMRCDIDGCQILLCHGSPWDTDQYIYPDADSSLMRRCADQASDVVVMGHTHYPMSYLINSTLVVNPGSVGQPRDRRPGAHWAILDTSTRSIDLRCEPYDSTPVIREAQLRHPELPYLAEVLERT